MKSNARRWKFDVYFGMLVCFLGLAPAIAFASDDWLEGASGYDAGRNEAISSHKPMVVYFYTDWCPYCRRFSKQVLSSASVQKALSSFVKVRINPEKGEREIALARRYEIDGYPSVYFENPASGQSPEEVMNFARSAEDFAFAAIQFSEKAQAESHSDLQARHTEKIKK